MPTMSSAKRNIAPASISLAFLRTVRLIADKKMNAIRVRIETRCMENLPWGRPLRTPRIVIWRATGVKH